MDISLQNVSGNTVTTKTYNLTVDRRKYTLLEYENESGRVIDEELRDDNGNSVDDADLLEQIQNFLDKNQPVS